MNLTFILCGKCLLYRAELSFVIKFLFSENVMHISEHNNHCHSNYNSIYNYNRLLFQNIQLPQISPTFLVNRLQKKSN